MENFSGKDDKRLLITISGKPFVDNNSITKLQVDKRGAKLNIEDTDNLYGVKWSDGNSLTVKGGELKALLDVRDGNESENGSPNYKGIPFI